MRFQCPLCKEQLLIENTEMGSTVQCTHCGKEVKVPTSRTAPGVIIGDFIIIREIGRGGMGIVYLAHQISLDRPAALKILADSYAKNAEFVVGFIKEARAAAKLNHPNIVQAYAVGDDDGIFYFAMEHVDGETMKNILDKKKVLPVEQAIDIVRQIAEALDYAWQEEKLVHRDIKPDNIMLTSSGRAKLADLGLAKVGNENSIEQGDVVMGTPQYISPEQMTGGALDNRTDVYSLGATFYQFLTGKFPYNGSSLTEIAQQHVHGTLVPPSQINPDIPENVSLVVVKMMAKDPADRYQSAGELAEDLANIKRGKEPSVAPRPGGKSSQKPRLGIKNPRPASASNADDDDPWGIDSTKHAPEPPPKPALKKTPETASAAPAPAAPAPRKAPALKPVMKPKKNEAVSTVPREVPLRKDQNKNEKKSSVFALIGKICGGLAALLLLAGAGLFCYYKFVKKEDPVQVLVQAKTALEQATAKPEPSEFMKAAAPVAAMLHSTEVQDQKKLAAACYEFLKKRIPPETDEEKSLQAEMIVCFARQDEAAIESARIAAIDQYEKEQQRLQAEAAEAERKRLEAERLAKEREAEKQVIAAENARIAAEKQRRINGAKNLAARLEHQMILDIVRYAEKKDMDGLMKVFQKNIDAVKDVPPDLKGQYSALISRARELQRLMLKVRELDKIFTSGDPRLVGMQIELKNNICTLTKIENGVLYAKTIGGREYSAPIRELVYNRRFLQFAENAGTKLNMKTFMPHYFFWLGAYVPASRISFGSGAYSKFVMDYLKEAVKEPSVKSKLASKFRGVPEYDKMFPSRSSAKKPAPKKAPAKKPAPKKAPAKKPAAKKK
ncbi:MAG: protein kinase [Lentisphaeria bacterium]|nr:protein kinase [Lentisphaeria bacterium]